MKYAIHVTGTGDLQFDKEERVFIDIAKAKNYAMVLANQILASGQTGVWVSVIDEDGKMYLGLHID